MSVYLRRCSQLCRMAAKLHHGENAGWSGNGLEMVWFSRRAPERASMTHRSTTILQAENQNRSQTGPVFGGGDGFVIFEIGSAGGAEPVLSRRQLPRVHGTTREGNYEAISRAAGTRPQRHRESPDMFPLCASVANY